MATSIQQNEDMAIITVHNPARSKGLFGLFQGSPKLPEFSAGTLIYSLTTKYDGSDELQQINEQEARGKIKSPNGALLYFITRQKFSFNPTFSKIFTDNRNQEWDFRVEGTLSIADPDIVIKNFSQIASSESPVNTGIAESWVASRISALVSRELRKYKVDDLINGELGPEFWQQKISIWLRQYGLNIHVVNSYLESAEDEAARAQEARLQELSRRIATREKEWQEELREFKSRAEYEKKQNEIANDQKLSQREREHRLDLLAKQHFKEVIEAEAEIEKSRRETEHAALEHEKKMALLRHDIETVNNVQERDEISQKSHQAIMQKLNDLEIKFQKLAEHPDNLLAQLSGKNYVKANQAAERLVSPEFDFSASFLSRMGFNVPSQQLFEALKQKSQYDGEKVVVNKRELVTRDIGTAKVKGLPVNTSLQFEFSTEKGGYVTLLNVGTSGSVYVHVPNAFVTLHQAKVEEGKYYIPGPELLPWNRLRQLGLDYVEVGPPGWEHIAVLISDRPLISVQVMERADLDMPLIKLQNTELVSLFDTLINEPESSWAAGVLSFLVI